MQSLFGHDLASKPVLAIVSACIISALLTSAPLVALNTIWSETLCWIILGFILLLYNWRFNVSLDKTQWYKPSGYHPTIIACSISIGAICRDLNGDVSRIIPLVTVCLLSLRMLPAKRPAQVSLDLGMGNSEHNAALNHPIWLQMLFSMTCLLIIWALAPVGGILVPVVFVVSQVGLYQTLKTVSEKDLEFIVPSTVSKHVASILLQTVPLLLSYAVITSYLDSVSITTIASTLPAALLKATWWGLMFYATLEGMSWELAPVTQTFGIASALSTYQSFNFGQTLASASVGMVAQVQSWLLVSKSTKARFLVLLPALYPLLSLFLAHDMPQLGRPDLSFTSASRYSAVHPVQVLATQGLASFDEMLARQSTTLEAAILAYQSRYHRNPPPGFDKWFAYAQERDSQIIDDYDVIPIALEPFWLQQPAHLRELMLTASQQGVLHNMTLENGIFSSTDEDCWIGAQFAEMLGTAVKDLPNVHMLTNGYDEPIVILPGKNQPAAEDDKFFRDNTHERSWDLVTQSCEQPLGLQPSSAQTFKTLFNLPFVEDIKETQDLCQHPEYKHLHGMFVSPATLLYTTEPVPIWSQATPSTFGDILFPSPWYWTHEDEELEAHDVAWENKTNNLYWSGSTTGGMAATPNWHEQQRQRFVAKSRQLLGEPTTFLSEASSGHWQSYQAREILSQLYDVKFTNLVQCDEPECKAEEEYFGIEEADPFSKVYQSRFVMDIDGNSFSGRYYNLLTSRSVVLKQTIFREWHDDRLIPWVHYVPISLEMDELPEVMRYMALTKEGAEIARRIADNGRSWAKKTLRREDAGVFVYRLLLEYARVLDYARDETRV